MQLLPVAISASSNHCVLQQGKLPVPPWLQERKSNNLWLALGLLCLYYKWYNQVNQYNDACWTYYFYSVCYTCIHAIHIWLILWGTTKWKILSHLGSQKAFQSQHNEVKNDPTVKWIGRTAVNSWLSNDLASVCCFIWDLYPRDCMKQESYPRWPCFLHNIIFSIWYVIINMFTLLHITLFW